MKIGIAGPIDITFMRDLFPPHTDFPETVSSAHIASLTFALYNRGHEIVIFALSGQVKSTRRIDGDRISAYICPLRRPRYQMLDLFRGERHSLRDAMQVSGCDVIHAHWTYDFGWAAVESGLPHVVSAHDVPMAVLRFARHPYWLLKPLLAWPVLRKARCVTAVSPYCADAIRSLVPPEREIIVVPNSIQEYPLELIKTKQAHSAASPFSFGAVFNGWSSLKNGKRLVEAFGILRTEFGEQVQLLMFGFGLERDGPAHRWSRRWRLADGVQFLGWQQHRVLLSRLATDVDALVHPSLEETFCNAAAEAMAREIPVVGGLHSGAIPWLLDYGRAGMLVDVTSPAAIAQGMRSLLKDADLRRTLGRLGSERVLNEWPLEKIAQKYESVLEDAMKEQMR